MAHKGNTLVSSIQGIMASAFQAKEQNRLREAEVLFARAAKLAPKDAVIAAHLAMTQIQRQNLRDALKTLSQAMRQFPSDVAIRSNLGGLLCQMGRHRDAVPHLRAAAEIASDSAEVLNNLGLALDVCGDRDGAYEVFAQAHMRNSGEPKSANPKLRANFRAIAEARINHQAAQSGAAGADVEAMLDHALAVDPHWQDMAHRRSLCLLAQGRLAEAWPHYRQHYPDLARVAAPQWDCRSSVDGTLLVRAEQGIGEQIMFSSIINQIIGQCRHLVVECDRRLVALLAPVYPQVSFIGWSDPPQPRLLESDIVRQAQMSEVFAALRPDIASIAQNRPRLAVDHGRVAELRRNLAPNGETVIGFSWASPRSPFNNEKSIPLDFWANLLQLPARFLPLQYEDELPGSIGNANIIADTGLDPLNDLSGLAAALSACDLVVTISNVTAHLAGVLNVPTRILLGPDPFWHWFLETDASPFYPSAKLFRRCRTETSWAPLMARTCNYVDGMLAAKANAL